MSICFLLLGDLTYHYIRLSSPCTNRNPIPKQRRNVAEKLNHAMQLDITEFAPFYDDFLATKPFGITMSLLRAIFR